MCVKILRIFQSINPRSTDRFTTITKDPLIRFSNRSHGKDLKI